MLAKSKWNCRKTIRFESLLFHRPQQNTQQQQQKKPISGIAMQTRNSKMRKTKWFCIVETWRIEMWSETRENLFEDVIVSLDGRFNKMKCRKARSRLNCFSLHVCRLRTERMAKCKPIARHLDINNKTPTMYILQREYLMALFRIAEVVALPMKLHHFPFYASWIFRCCLSSRLAVENFLFCTRISCPFFSCVDLWRIFGFFASTRDEMREKTVTTKILILGQSLTVEQTKWTIYLMPTHMKL